VIWTSLGFGDKNPLKLLNQEKSFALPLTPLSLLSLSLSLSPSYHQLPIYSAISLC